MRTLRQQRIFVTLIVGAAISFPVAVVFYLGGVRLVTMFLLSFLAGTLAGLVGTPAIGTTRIRRWDVRWEEWSKRHPILGPFLLFFVVSMFLGGGDAVLFVLAGLAGLPVGYLVFVWVAERKHT